MFNGTIILLVKYIKYYIINELKLIVTDLFYNKNDKIFFL